VPQARSDRRRDTLLPWDGRRRDGGCCGWAARPEVERPDTLVVEEPLEIRVGGKALAVTMRTPGSDMELAAGFLVSEGVISAAGHVLAQRYCAGATEEGLNTYNVLDVSLAAGVAPPDPSVERAFYTTSSCGLCGKASLDASARPPAGRSPTTRSSCPPSS
jgi:formate dehydrogenase assembly factor FdhD